MKKRMIIIAAVAALFSAACTTGGPLTGNQSSAPAPTPAQIAAQVCPPVLTAMTGLNALEGLPVSAQNDLAAVTPVVSAVCTVGATVNTNNLQQLSQSALPAIVGIVKASKLSVDEQNSIIVDVTAAQLILTTAAQVKANLAQSVPNAAASVPATAPGATSPSK